MTRDEFLKVYNDQYRCSVKYRGKDGSTQTGIALDKPVSSVTGQYFVFVNSFTNRVRMHDVISVSVTNSQW